MKTQNFTNNRSRGNATTTSQKGLLHQLFYVLILLSFVFGFSTGTNGSELLKLEDGNSVISLGGGKIAVLSPPPVTVLYTYNLPGAHIGNPLVLKLNPLSQIMGLFVVPTTGGNVALFSSSGLINTYNLPGDHIGPIIEMKNGNGFMVRTTGGLCSFFDNFGNFVGTVNLPGEHATGPYNIPVALDGDRYVVANQNGEVFLLEIDPATGLPVQVGSAVNYPGSPAAYGYGWYINQNMQIFRNGAMAANLPGAFAFKNAGLLVNQNNQIFNFNNPLAPPLNLGGAPAAQPLKLNNGNQLNINQNFQIVNLKLNGPNGGPIQIGQPLNLPGAPFVPVNKDGVKMLDSLVIAGGENEGRFLAVNQNGQIWIVNPGDSLNGPSIHAGPLNLPNSPLYVVRNGVKGVYVIATTGGQVFIVDARGSDAPKIIGSFNFAGEHTDAPKMGKDNEGNNTATISTTSGAYVINKSDNTYEKVEEVELEGEIVACCAMVMPGAAMPGQVVAASCDMSMMGEEEAGMAEMQLMNSDTEEVIFAEVSFEPPFCTEFLIPEYALPGDSYTFSVELFDFEGNYIACAAKAFSVVSSVQVEAVDNIQALPGEMVLPTFEIWNNGYETAILVLELWNELLWFVEPQFMEITLAPGEMYTMEYVSFVPEYEELFSNRFTLEAINLINPTQNTSDYLDVMLRPEEQVLSIFQGWSGISSFLDPSNPNIENMFLPVVDDLVIMQNFSGVYWPELQINTLLNWNPLDGYIVKTLRDVEVIIQGFDLPNGTLELDEGWNLSAMLNRTVGFTSDIFNYPEIELVKEVAGSKVFWPVQNIFSLVTINPGEAYFVYANAPVTISFEMKSSAIADDKTSEVATHDMIPWEVVDPTPTSHLIVLPGEADSDFRAGDIVGAFNTSGLCSGYAIIGKEEAVLAVYGDDVTTSQIDGLLENEEITFRMYRPSSDDEIEIYPVFDMDLPMSGHSFVNHGLSKMSMKTGLDGNTALDKVRVFPNPASDYLVITSDATEMQNLHIQIVNMLGAIVFESIEGAQAKTTIDVSDLAEGCYVLRLSSESQNSSTKIVIRN